jgi:hypothetical protein
VCVCVCVCVCACVCVYVRVCQAFLECASIDYILHTYDAQATISITITITKMILPPMAGSGVGLEHVVDVCWVDAHESLQYIIMMLYCSCNDAGVARQRPLNEVSHVSI